MKWYVEVIGSLDAVMIGPFATNGEALAYTLDNKREQFDFSVMDEPAMQRSFAEHGEIPIQSP